MYPRIKIYISTIPKNIWILVAIILVGIFFRTYNFHSWLYFYPDQARDVMISQDVLTGESSWPTLGAIAASTPFKLGPIYYYFQIVAAKIFGASPIVMAFPDWLFGVLTIPLLYFYLKRYFAENMSLALTGLYSISFYAIRYSRFAWNVNPIPFFVLLFMISLYEILLSKEKVELRWVFFAGLSLGVGIQLHTILLVSMPLMLGLIFLFLANKNKKIIYKFLIIGLISIFLNLPQIISDADNNFSNTHHFVNALIDRSPDQGNGVVNNFIENVLCHSQAFALYLSGVENNDTCNTLSYYDSNLNVRSTWMYVIVMFNILFGMIIFIFGTFSSVYFYKKEKESSKKIFLSLNLLYVVVTFLIILPIIGHNGQVRYFLPIFFVPFLFLGLILKFIVNNCLKNKNLLMYVILCLLLITNFATISTEALLHASEKRSNPMYVVLGEAENIAKYIKEQSLPQKEAYIFGGQKYMQNFYKPLDYLESKNDLNLQRGGRRLGDVPAGKIIFFIAQKCEAVNFSIYYAYPSEIGAQASECKSFGNIGIYKLINPNLK